MQEAVTKGADEKFCADCGAVIKAKAEICPKCGVRQLAPPRVNPLGTTTTSGRNRVVAGIVALLLGGLGIHKFYLGKAVQGVLYLLFCWTFIPALIALIEGIRYLLMSDDAFMREYGGA